MRKTSINILKLKQIAAGGEGIIYESNLPDRVVKIYHQSRPEAFARHLEYLSKLPATFITPIDIFIVGGKCVGFDMKYVNFNNYWLFNNLFNKGFCSSNGLTLDFKINVLKELRKAIEELHALNIKVGDLNQYNLFVGKAGDILFVDTDSYETPTNKHAGVLLDDIRDFTSTTISEKTDMWAYDILAFWATTFCHPFKWVAPGNTESLELRVKRGKSILTKIAGIKIPPLYLPPTGGLLQQFQEIFSGRRYMVYFDGTYVQAPTVVTTPTTSSSLIIRELYTGVLDVNACLKYVAVKKGKEWILVETMYPKVTREIITLECDELYPSNEKYAYRKGNVLFSQEYNNYTKQFGQSVFYYNNGFLAVVDYDNYLQWNFNINNQLSGIDNTQTPVFAKSIVLRNSLIQNFGRQKMVNIPNNNSYTLITVPEGTKDAIYNMGHVAVEVREKTKIHFHILRGTHILSLDYLPHFAISQQNIMFVPDNGFVEVYKEMNLITRFDCPQCTRSSKLYNTNSGIMMLEGTNLYLLNTK